jgi:hypothetical protein
VPHVSRDVVAVAQVKDHVSAYIRALGLVFGVAGIRHCNRWAREVVKEWEGRAWSVPVCQVLYDMIESAGKPLRNHRSPLNQGFYWGSCPIPLAVSAVAVCWALAPLGLYRARSIIRGMGRVDGFHSGSR